MDGAFLLVTGVILVGLVSVGISTVRGEREQLRKITSWAWAGAQALGLDGAPYQELAATVRIRGTFEGRAAWSKATREGLELGVVLDESLHAQMETLVRLRDPSSRSEVPDPAFADAMITRGRHAALLAALSRPARQALIAANKSPLGPFFEIGERALTLRMGPPTSPEQIAADVQRFVRLLELLPAGVGHEGAGLLARVRDREELEAVRIQALKLLTSRAPDAAETEAARQAALQSGVPRLAAVARGATGGEGGRLSLAAGPEGGLSVAEGEAGAVSEAGVQGGLSEVEDEG